MEESDLRKRQGWGRLQKIAPLIILGFAVVAIIFIVVGGIFYDKPSADWHIPLYTALVAFSVDGAFLDIKNQPSAPTWVGIFLAALVTYAAIIIAGFTLFSRQIARLRALLASNHIVIVGDDPEAETLARRLAIKHAVVLVSPLEVANSVLQRLITIDRALTTWQLIAAASIIDARTVVVMLADERLNAALATSMAMARKRHPAPMIWCRVSERFMADRVSGASFGEPSILIFDETGMMAREAFARHPAHAAAERMAAKRVHFLVAGFGNLGQAMVEEAIFSGTATGLHKPMITVLDVDAAACEAVYRANRPALDMAVDIAFIELDLVTGPLAPALVQPAFTALTARCDISPATGLALCLPSDSDNLRIALALPEMRRRQGRYIAPTFMRVRDHEKCAMVLAPESASVFNPTETIIPLEAPTQLMVTDILDIAKRDWSARQLHEKAYLERSTGTQPTRVDWDQLKETYKRSNRRGADHINVKLWSLGLVSERDPHGPIVVERETHAALIASLLTKITLGESTTLDMLAELEHRRWVADRIIDGWTHGVHRDDDLKLHPSLLDYQDERLDEAERQKDGHQVVTLLSSVVPAASGAMPELRVALAGHRNLDTEEENSAVESLIVKLVKKLETFRSPYVVTLISQLAPGADLAATEGVAAALVGKDGKERLRLLILESVPYETILRIAAAEQKNEEGARIKFIAGQRARRAALFGHFGRVDVVHIGLAGHSNDSYMRDKPLLQRGLARANAYMARRADIVAVLWDGKEARGPGGTGDLVKYCRDPLSIPEDLDPGPPVRAIRADKKDPLIIVDVKRN